MTALFHPILHSGQLSYQLQIGCFVNIDGGAAVAQRHERDVGSAGPLARRAAAAASI